jgi:predicted Zn-dependent protease
MNKQIELIERNLDVTRLGCKFSRVKSIERQSYHGRAARVIANGKAGHASTTDGLSDDQLVRRASEMARVNVPKTLSFPSEIVARARHGEHFPAKPSPGQAEDCFVANSAPRNDGSCTVDN